jgi:hypothetical protein
MDDFVQPVPERLPLIGGKHVDVKRRLNHGETEDMYARIYSFGVTNRKEVRTAKIVAYLLGWSLTRNGQPVPYTPELPEQERIDTVRSLDPDRALEIYTAIEAHEDAMAAARQEEKKILNGGPIANATSASPSAAAGASSGSAPST